MKVYCKKHDGFYEKDEGCTYCEDDEHARPTPVDLSNPFCTSTDEDLENFLSGWFGNMPQD